MSDKQTTRCAASGAHLFARYALTCCENGSEGNSKRSSSDISRLRDLVLRNDPTEAVLTQILLCSMFPSPVDECFKSDGVWDENPADFVWLIDRVQIHWRYAHTGPKTDVVPSRPENGCRTIRAKVLRMHSIVGNAFFVDVEGQEVLVIDLFGLNPNPGEFVYFHQRVICEVEEPTDYLRTVGLDGGENHFGRAEPPDSEETYEQGVRGGEVIRPQELPTDSPATVPAMYFTSRSRDFDMVGELLTGRRSLVDEEDPGDVKIGVLATVPPPTTQAQCDCGQECKGGHPCPKAPHYVQFRDPSDKVVSTGVAVGKSSTDCSVYETAPVGVGGRYELVTGVSTPKDPVPPEYEQPGCPFNA